MARLTIGVDINDELLSAVVVAGKGKDIQVRACASVILEKHEEISEKLSVLLDQLQWRGGRCISGLPLSLFSLRNFILPFTNEKKIEQILPLELEEHLLAPVSEQVFATAVTPGNDGTRLLVAALEKKILRNYLEVLQGRNLDPVIVCPAVFAQAKRLQQDGAAGQNFLLLYWTPGFMSMAVCHQGRIVFMRRLPYPEQVFSQSLFSVEVNRFMIGDTPAAAEAVSSVCRMVQHSMDFFTATAGLKKIEPDQVVLAGPLELPGSLRKCVDQELGLQSTICNLVESGNLDLAGQVVDSWQPSVYDRALALALLRSSSRQVTLNFRKDEFAVKNYLLSSKRHLAPLALLAGLLVVLLFGYLYVDYKALEKEHNRLAAKMEQVFKKSFPEVTRIVDPVAQLQATLREVETSSVSIPLFTREKRVLAILADISARVPADVSLHVSRLLIDQDSVKIKGTTDAFNNVNTIKNLLARSPRFPEVHIVSATKAKDKNVIRFEINLQLGENG